MTKTPLKIVCFVFIHRNIQIHIHSDPTRVKHELECFDYFDLDINQSGHRASKTRQRYPLNVIETTWRSMIQFSNGSMHLQFQIQSNAFRAMGMFDHFPKNDHTYQEVFPIRSHGHRMD